MIHQRMMMPPVDKDCSLRVQNEPALLHEVVLTQNPSTAPLHGQLSLGVGGRADARVVERLLASRLAEARKATQVNNFQQQYKFQAPAPPGYNSVMINSTPFPQQQHGPAQQLYQRRTSGIDLLRSASVTLSPSNPKAPYSSLLRAQQHYQQAPQSPPRRVSLSTPIPSPTTVQVPTIISPGPKQKFYIDELLDNDVISGRGGLSNHHPGNKRYRQVVSEMKTMYRQTETKTLKTDLSRAIVEHVCSYGGRFVKKEEGTDRFYVLTKAEARKKTSQALRETKELKWTV